MCTVQEEQLISCQLNFVPLGDHNYHTTIENVLEIIRAEQLDYDVGEISTVIRGTPTRVFSLLKTIASASKDSQYVMNILISNTCGVNTCGCTIPG
jgi:uncharacterized protein YqgV (UPF0045/DUF77 family)